MQASLPDRPIGADLVASMASMVQDAGGVFAAMGDAVLQAADETERLGTIELAKANPQTQMLAWWLIKNAALHATVAWHGAPYHTQHGPRTSCTLSKRDRSGSFSHWFLFPRRLSVDSIGHTTAHTQLTVTYSTKYG